MSHGQISDNGFVTWVAEEDQGTTSRRHIAWGSAQSKDRNVKEGKWSEKGVKRESEDVECKLWEGRLKQRQLWEASWRRGQSILANREPSHVHLNLKATIENTVISAAADSLDSQIICFFFFSLVDVLSFWFYLSTSSACRFFAGKLKFSSRPQTS